MTENNREVLHTRSLDLVKNRLGKLWQSNLQYASTMRTNLENQLGQSNADLLEGVASEHPKRFRQGDPHEWVSLMDAGADSQTEQGQDSFLALATELAGGNEALQQLVEARNNDGKNNSIITIVLNPDTNLTADIECEKGFDGVGKDPNHFYPRMVRVSAPTHFIPTGTEVPINPAAELVGSAIRNALAIQPA